jgi:FkbM family methyltransferase
MHATESEARQRLPQQLLPKFNKFPPEARAALLSLVVPTTSERAWADLNCAVNHSASQFYEDVLLLPMLLRAAGRRRGSYVELGALDGRRWSNTILLEACYSWSGLLIEGNPRNFEALRTSGRQAVLRHSAVCARGVDSVVFSADGDSVAGQLDQMPPEHLHKWRHRGFLSGRNVSVPCAPLSRLMSDAGHRRADFLSLDVEGAEATVLEHSDPAAFNLILMEWKDGPGGRGNERAADFITRAGLRMILTPRVPYSRIFVQPWMMGAGNPRKADDKAAHAATRHGSARIP